MARTLCIAPTSYCIFIWILSVISTIFLIPLLLYTFLLTLKLKVLKLKIVYLVTILFLLIAICSLYLARFYFSFKNTQYAMSKTTLLFFIFGLLVQFILSFLVVQYAIKVWWALINNPSTYLSIQQTMSHIYLSFTILNILYIILLLFLYLRITF
eukprot:31064_1